MNRTLRSALVALTIAAVALPCGASADWLAPRITIADVVGVAENDTLNMRAEPSPRAAIVGRLPSHAGVDVERCQRNPRTSKEAAPNWCRVLWNGDAGWVNARYLLIHDGVHTNVE